MGELITLYENCDYMSETPMCWQVFMETMFPKMEYPKPEQLDKVYAEYGIVKRPRAAYFVDEEAQTFFMLKWGARTE